MERNKKYKFTKKHEVVYTDGSTEDYKGRTFELVGETSSYYELKLEGEKLPLMMSKVDINKLLSTGKIVEIEYSAILDEEISENTKDCRVPITEDSIIRHGFTKVANLYLKEGDSLQLIKGHTWHYTKKSETYGRDVKYIDELV